MKKNRATVIYFFIAIILLIILITYTSFYSPTYENKITEHENDYILDNKQEQFFKYIDTADYKKELTIEEAQNIEYDNLFVNYFNNNIKNDLINIKNQIKENIRTEEKKYIIPNTKYGNIIFFQKSIYNNGNGKKYSNYTLIFNDTLNKLYYECAYENREEVKFDYESNSDTIKQEITDSLNEINIHEIDFQNKTIEKNMYIIDDESNNLKVKYDMSKKNINAIFYNL